MSSFENFVQCRIVTPLAASATDVALHAAVAPYRLPPEAGGVLVLTDSPGNPSVVEVVRYSHRTGLALYGLQRGQEGTTARDWTGPVFCYQALMAGDFQSILDELNAGIDGKVDKAAGQSLMTDAERTKLSGIAAGAQVNTVTSVAGKTGAVALAKGDVGLGNVDNTSDAAKPVSTAQQAALNLKANLASPTFTGIPKAPTPAATDNTTQLATTAFVQAVVAALVNGAPGALDQLSELAAAMGNDPNFATTMLNALALKAPLASPALTGNPTAPTPAADDSDTSIATTAFVRAAMALFGVGANTPTYRGNIDLPADVPKGWAFCASGSGTTGTLPTIYGLLWSGGIVNDGFSQEWHEVTAAGTTKRRFYRSVYNGALGPWQEIWHTGNLVKQTSPTDTTAGAMMAVGAFGLGAKQNQLTSNVDLDTTEFPIGFYSGSGWINTPAGNLSSTTWAYLQVENLASAFPLYAKQTFTLNQGAARVWVRAKFNGVWGSWRELVHSHNILGTVSQSAGVPTGAIIERGGNANGEYTRYADGTIDIWHLIPLIHTANTELVSTWDLPVGVSTVAGSQVFINVRGVASTNLYSTTKMQGTVNAGGISVQLRTQFSASQSYTLAVMVKGRWS